jgi:glutamate synthase domain-containing protein 3
MVEELYLNGLTESALNTRLQALAKAGGRAILRNPHARHNLVVNVCGPLEATIEGSAGFYCCGFMNGPRVTVTGNVGWYAADNMLGGALLVRNNAGSNLAPSMIGGLVLVRGSAGSRVGYGLKGGTVLVCGDVGMLTGQQMLGGRIVLLGAAGPGAGESMYGGAIYYRRGALAASGTNNRARRLEPAEAEALAALLAENGLGADPGDFECLTPTPGKQKFHLFRPQLTAREKAVS